jgi:hypothetical protein
MIDFHRSHFMWKSRPWYPDEFYRYPGGFVGTPGQVYHVRFKLDAMATIIDEQRDQETEIFIGAPCRTEYTIATRNLFQIPSAEFRLAFSRNYRLSIAARPSHENEPTNVMRLADAFQAHQIRLRTFNAVTALTDTEEIATATLAGEWLNARSTYRDADRGLTVRVEYPVNLINVNTDDSEFQVCTGPVILPDLATWDGCEVKRVFLAHVAFTSFDHVEFILRREVEAAPDERVWLDQPRGRDRLELLDPNRQPPDYPPRRPRATTYNETWEFPAQNVVLRAQLPD